MSFFGENEFSTRKLFQFPAHIGFVAAKKNKVASNNIFFIVQIFRFVFENCTSSNNRYTVCLNPYAQP